jgi:thioredoxin-like negative regulator of GroEL
MYIKVDNQQSVENFKSNTKKGYWIILYYASWCPHCQTMKPEWEKFANKYSSEKDINVADVESEFLDHVGSEHKQNVAGFPTIVSCKNGRKISDFNGPRTSDEIDKFANSISIGSSQSGESNSVPLNMNNSNNNRIQRNNTQALLNTILKVGKPLKKTKSKGKTLKSKKSKGKSVMGKKSKKSKKSKRSKKSRK